MTKIQALEKTIYNLENDVYEYKWESTKSCNCGVLARTLLNGRYATDCGFHDSPKLDGGGVFANAAFCMTTNLPLPEVFQVLKEAGFTHQELFELEYLGNAKITKGIPDTKIQDFFLVAANNAGCLYSNKEIVIAYLKEWVKILEPKVREVIRYVSVPASITKHTELIEN